MNLVLTRFAYLADCTLGELKAGPLTLATIERPWIENPAGPGGMPRQSCVPEGEYRLIQHSGGAFSRVWALVNPDLGVWYQPNQIPKGLGWGRSAILIHAGNRVRDVIGCIAAGRKHAPWSNGENSVRDSQLAINALRGVIGTGEHVITITSKGTSK